MRISRWILAASLLLGGSVVALEDDFAASSLDTVAWYARLPLDGARVLSGRVEADALDGKAARLIYPADQPVWGPRYATQLMARAPSHYGSYESRLRSARSAVGEGVISGFFTWASDGTDQDGDGLIDNHEIDFEFSNVERGVLYLSVWTAYDDSDGSERFRRTARRIDLRRGRVWGTPAGGEGDWDLVRLDDLDFADATYDHGARFYTYGFDWAEDSVHFWVDLEDGAGPRTLWTHTGVPDVDIPSLPSPIFLNVWHNPVNWWTRADAPPPSRNAILRADYVSAP